MSLPVQIFNYNSMKMLNLISMVVVFGVNGSELLDLKFLLLHGTVLMLSYKKELVVMLLELVQ